MNAWGPSMNDWGLLLAWSAVQVGVLLAAGAGVYFVVRRRNPAAGAWAIAAVLIAAVLLSGLAISPWPQWWSVDDVWQAGGESAEDAALANASLAKNNSNSLAGDGAAEAGPGESDPPASDAALSAAWREFLAGFQKSLERNEQSRAWRWPAWLAVAVLVCIGLGLLRLGVALLAVQRYRARAVRVEDAEARALLAEIKRQLGCARRIELRESAGLGSPCTLGWVRPVVILPGDWRSWSESELRSVLAHEVAHVARGDFAVGIVAQLGVVLHFYNPLAWWLLGRLRLEQEMAADLCGARLAGGRETYLTTLARMALRQSDLPLAARPFLPARGTLLRRVEMLHKETRLPEGTVSWSGRLAVAALLLSASGLLAGLRVPSETIGVAAPPPEKPAADVDSIAKVPIGLQLRDAHARVDVLRASFEQLETFRRENPRAVTQESEKAYQESKRNLKEAELALAAVENDPANRDAKLRSKSINQLKHLGIALHTYHDANKRFPAAVEIGPDGKTPHSWRVAILPYIEGKGEELSKRYRLDEPWDSEHNKQVISDGADLFAVPTEVPTENCGYFVLVGPGSVFFPADSPTKIRQITDGTSKTICVVEAKREIPWTKPEDIAFEADKPLPKLGGFFDGGYNTLFSDASVLFLPANLKDSTLRMLISKDGREPWDWEDVRPDAK